MSKASKEKANQTSHAVCDGKSYGDRPLKPITGIAPPKVQQQPKDSSSATKEKSK